MQQALGRRIRQLREKKGWSQEDFAARSGLHRTFVGKIERGLKNTTILTLMMISRALGISVAELLRGLEKRVEGRRQQADGVSLKRATVNEGGRSNAWTNRKR